MINNIIFIIYIPYIIYLRYKQCNPLLIYTKLKSKYKGTVAYSKLISQLSPYSGSISPIVEEFTETNIKVSMTEHRYIKNPFKSIHAIAISNLGELTSGLLMMEILKRENKRGIITSIKTYYQKKARGKLTAVCDKKWMKGKVIKTKVYNTNKELVCELNCKWKINYNI